MAFNLKVQKKVLNFTEDKKEVYVVSADRGDVIDADKISTFIAQDTGARPAQVKMILTSLIDSMMSWIEEGHGVRLGNFGSFLPSVKSASSEDPNEAAVKRVRLIFYPSKELAARIGDVSYSTVNEFKVESTEEDSGESGGTDTGGSGGSGTEME